MRLIDCRVCADDLNHLEKSFIHCDWQRNVHKVGSISSTGILLSLFTVADHRLQKHPNLNSM
uniref:Uncharacterized protein n=1 Tax=Anguilla anguilla TaxID=7936 RepID=A0A0E9PQA3_ANGAN